ncbi:hypothetical protein [Streptococcus ovuberis]|uniref:CopG family transcriptional regulator n=1 Tax=Streptococcus ovuberis TaxID=1936207 RepID=A0A7X6S0E2_9STRE|nr:hypothetical protein [Streptococcus ovuberis]NKZ19682.1 hypothetical protein [Streptococcus ovuberis]
MAFKPKKNEIAQVITETATLPSSIQSTDTGAGGHFDTFERTKQYQFTLQPSVRTKIDELAKEKGFRSASAFVNDLFKKM